MILWHSLLGREVAKHSRLLKIISAHYFSAPGGEVVTTRSYYVGPCAKLTFQQPARDWSNRLVEVTLLTISLCTFSDIKEEGNLNVFG
jgi:hypothetical protein